MLTAAGKQEIIEKFQSLGANIKKVSEQEYQKSAYGL